ncbi:unnamed protein product (macronuclear) [Paramecium tetraurelia]|uniref:Uncharacterized protein n=1 Tax=Paramecium tetraurelia TaxID=5888 RepID=A0DUB8_PARTE|nr:uncharacterized protein GSPATT00020307001 [Paramecium tetraurelia]CAK86635.1 unnamed protein product [Paramecium tetraurelia]|eukprot:XP_001454032.1 hypothetical protein (macronuclear) [Paramecium tetraurelia strain d4-2]
MEFKFPIKNIYQESKEIQLNPLPNEQMIKLKIELTTIQINGSRILSPIFILEICRFTKILSRNLSPSTNPSQIQERNSLLIDKILEKVKLKKNIQNQKKLANLKILKIKQRKSNFKRGAQKDRITSQIIQRSSKIEVKQQQVIKQVKQNAKLSINHEYQKQLDSKYLRQYQNIKTIDGSEQFKAKIFNIHSRDLPIDYIIDSMMILE